MYDYQNIDFSDMCTELVSGCAVWSESADLNRSVSHSGPASVSLAWRPSTFLFLCSGGGRQGDHMATRTYREGMISTTRTGHLARISAEPIPRLDVSLVKMFGTRLDPSCESSPSLRE
jgi:hypothetical protein